MATKKSKVITLSFDPSEIIGADITKSGEYKYASVGIKRGENERLRISYEWSGEGIPDFVMNLMSWMQANKEDIDKTKQEFEDEYKELKERL
ncbi:MAG: hypothetical protein DRO67_03480 [Candidatus Asgardarchaeum californiense]|nr:MAG: hypothetical protein DRO67_03480 [Candidatus Asgardarchaeum californiense]